MFRFWAQFFREDRGQDLAEYCLLVALVALLGLGIAYRVMGGVHDIWGVANTNLASGNSTVSSPNNAGAAGANNR